MDSGQTTKIPILTYHSIDESNSVISTRFAVFEKQMDFLSENAFNVVSLKSLINALGENQPLPAKTIALTFDDGYQNFYSQAFPALKKHNFTATVFLITDFCGGYNDWPGNLKTLERSRLLSWNEIRELSQDGIEFGAHTQTHPNLTKISEKQVYTEMSASKNIIEDKLGTEVMNFAYPYGKYNYQIKNITGELFKSACSTNLGKVNQKSDLLSLKRVDSYYFSNDKFFSALDSIYFDRYLQFRQIMRDAKQIIYR